MPLDLTTNKAYLRTIQIYENEKQFYFIGSHSINKTLLIFTISKLKFTGNSTGCYELKDILIEHQKEYDKESFDELILALSKEASTQLRFIEEVKCIFGFVKFYFGHYAILVSEYSKVGKIGDYIINRVEKLKLLPLFLVNTTNVYLEIESKYLTIFKNFDPSRQVYFSFTYDLTKTLQRNFLENLKKETIKEYFEIFLTKNINNEKIQTLKNTTNNTFLWNNYHIKEFFKIIENKLWATFFIYGFFEQIECMNYGLRFLVTVIARRNRNYAGTRYLKRGINDDGNVANDVETEQILEEISTSCAEKPVISSFIHIRGSVPIYWYQEQNGIMPKPDIKVNYWDVFYESTKRHFFLLNQRYGSPIISCNLTKKKEGDHKQEELLNESYQAGVDYINNDLKLEEKIMYLHYDLKNERRQAKFYRHFYEISYGLIEKTNMFSFIPDIRSNSTYNLELQSGVIRSNCVDCLDRTNVFQQVIGTAVMVNQLRSMGVNAKEPNNEEHMFGILTELYKKMGHELSSQYAGSLAHKQTIKDNRTMMNKIIDKVPEIFNTCKRYFNNSFNDQYKQASINLFLGKYKIGKMPGHLWDLTTDSMLHRKERIEKIKNGWASEALEIYSKFNLIDDLLENINLSNDHEIILLKSKNIVCNSSSNPSSKSKKYPKYTLDKDFLDYVKITQRDTNKYLVSLENYHLYKKKKGYKKNITDIDSFYFLDIDHKTMIKDFYNLNYNLLYDNFSLITTPIHATRSNNFLNSSNNNSFIFMGNSFLRSQESNNTNMRKSAESFGETPKYLDLNDNEFLIKRYNTRASPKRKLEDRKNSRTRKNDWSFKKLSNDENLDSQGKQIEKPKYDVKITSFEMDANEINLTNEFVDPDPKYLQNSEYHQLDYFLTMDINSENYSKFFDPSFNAIEENKLFIDKKLDGNVISNEFVEDFLQRISNTSSKRKEHKLRELKNADYLIYDVNEKQFYKKLKINADDPVNVTPTGNSSSGNFTNITSMNTNLTPTNKKPDESPKVKVKVKKLPIKIFEDHI